MCCRKRMFVLSLSQLRDSSTPSLYIVYIYIDFFVLFLRCCWPKEENLLVEFDELTCMEYAASCPSIPFQRVLSSQILNFFFLLLGRCPDSQPRHFFYEPILERLRDSSRDSNGTVNSHQWGTSLGSKLNHSEIDSQRNSKEDS